MEWLDHNPEFRLREGEKFLGGVKVRGRRFTGYVLVDHKHGRKPQGVGDYPRLQDAREAVESWIQSIQALSEFARTKKPSSKSIKEKKTNGYKTK